MSHTHLSLQERYFIYQLHLYKLSLREIARRLNRAPSTISRELKRNNPYKGSVYFSGSAQAWSDERRRHPRHQKRLGCERLRTYVWAGLARCWSPEQIAGRIRLDFPDDPTMRIACETIYGWIYRDAKAGGLRWKALRRQHKKRRRQPRFGKARQRIPGRVSIHDRPKEVCDRKRFGDWEGDTVMGAQGRGAVVTLVERKSRFLLAAKLKSKQAPALSIRAVSLLRPLPRTWRRTMTFDNGSEFARFKDIEITTGIMVFFADPYAAWQRGTNENTNGLLRQFFPKGCDFNVVTQKDLAKAVANLNHRPRKCLDFKTPYEVRKEDRVAI